MGNTNEKRRRLLGMSQGKAVNRLRKMVLFDLLKQFNQNDCYRCKKKIINIENLSMEHKIPWMTASNPEKTFWDLTNIAFSHLACNIQHSNLNKAPLEHSIKHNDSPEGKAWCSKCRQYKLISEFHSNKSKKNIRLKGGLSWWCKLCFKEYKKRN